MTELSKMSRYSNQQLGISILMPEDWTVQALNQVQFRIFGLPEPGFEKYFDEYRSTMSYRLAEPDNSVSDWFEILIEQSNQEMAREYNEYYTVSEENCEIADRKAYVKYYEWTEKKTGLKLSQLQSLIYNDSRSFYLVNAATPTLTLPSPSDVAPAIALAEPSAVNPCWSSCNVPLASAIAPAKPLIFPCSSAANGPAAA